MINNNCVYLYKMNNMIRGGINKMLKEQVIFEDGKTHFRGGRIRKFTFRDRVRDVDHINVPVTIFLN